MEQRTVFYIHCCCWSEMRKRKYEEVLLSPTRQQMKSILLWSEADRSKINGRRVNSSCNLCDMIETTSDSTKIKEYLVEKRRIVCGTLFVWALRRKSRRESDKKAAFFFYKLSGMALGHYGIHISCSYVVIKKRNSEKTDNNIRMILWSFVQQHQQFSRCSITHGTLPKCDFAVWMYFGLLLIDALPHNKHYKCAANRWSVWSTYFMIQRARCSLWRKT